jgi:hypothetical protein
MGGQETYVSPHLRAEATQSGGPLRPVLSRVIEVGYNFQRCCHHFINIFAQYLRQFTESFGVIAVTPVTWHDEYVLMTGKCTVSKRTVPRKTTQNGHLLPV